jgi:hypothetical protein
MRHLFLAFSISLSLSSFCQSTKVDSTKKNTRDSAQIIGFQIQMDLKAWNELFNWIMSSGIHTGSENLLYIEQIKKHMRPVTK